MRHRPPPHIADRAVAALRRHGLVWLLLLVLPLHGLSAAIIQLIGQRHFHDSVPSHALGRVLWQPERDAVLASSRHDHAHAMLQRHHHGRDDASVIALDPLLPDAVVTDGSASAAAPSLLAPPPHARLFASRLGHSPWRAGESGWFVGWSSPPMERPPKA